jgi:AcrR family transcriptional regulator
LRTTLRPPSAPTSQPASTTPSLSSTRTRDRISGIASQLILARGFEAVSVTEIAASADVSHMTVFNYFASKKDIFLDRLPTLTA